MSTSQKLAFSPGARALTTTPASVLQGACRGWGDTRTPVVVGLAAGVVNVFLDPVFMFASLSVGGAGGSRGGATDLFRALRAVPGVGCLEGRGGVELLTFHVLSAPGPTMTGGAAGEP